MRINGCHDFYFMTASVRGQDEPNLALGLATRVDKKAALFARSGSQSQRKPWFILPSHGSSHRIKVLTTINAH